MVKQDGVFFRENAREKWETGNTDFNGTMVLGVNSFEGSLLETFSDPEIWTKAGISFAFYLCRYSTKV